MKKLLFLTIMLFAASLTFGLDYSIELSDSYGDGWNGGSIDVLVNGTVVLDDITLASGAGPESHAFTVDVGDVITTVYTAGSWAYENEYQIKDETGTVVAESGQGGVEPGNISYTVPAPPTCPDPANQIESNITQTSADLGWTENGTASTWEYAIGIAPFGPPTGAGTSTTLNPTNVTGLSANTTYDWYVRADCGGGDYSNWVGPSTFTTPCNPFSATFSENFDGVTTPDLPDCWSNLIVGASSYAYVETSTTNSYSAPNNIRMYNHTLTGASDYLLLITPPLSDLTSQLNQIRFYGSASGYAQDLIVGTMSDPTDETTFTAFQTIPLSINSYTEYTVMFNASYTLTDTYIAFRNGADVTYRYMNIDDFVYEPSPSCPPPSYQTESSITATTADLGWTDNAGASSWDIELGVTGFSPTGNPTATGVTNSYTYGSLTAVTTYDWYVRANCGGGDYSTWVGPSTFTTTVVCPAPTAQTETNITATSADLGWTDNAGASSWDIELGVTGFSPTGTPTATGVTNPYTYGSLNASTTYDWYVRANCGGGDYSTWTGASTFTTPCAAVTSFPSLENFEAFTVASNATGYTNCWSTSPANTTSQFRWNVDAGGTPTSSTGPIVDHTTGTAAGIYLFTEASSGSQGNEAYVYSPEYDLTSLTSPQIDFWYHMYGSAMGELHLDIDAGSGWVNDIMTALVGQQQSAQSDDWLQATVYLSAYTGQTVKFRFRGIRGSSYRSDMAIDDVTVGEAPSCPDPSDQTESGITTTFAILGWTDNAGASLWDIELGVTGFSPTGTPTATGVTNPYTYGSLTANTTYDWYVRADCGGGDYSNWIGPSTFTTLCEAYTLPIVEGFNAATTPSCWSETIVADPGLDPALTYVTSGSSPTCSPDEGTHMVKFNSYSCSNGAEIRLESPEFSTTGMTAAQVLFAWYECSNYSSYLDEGVTVQWSTDGSTWNDGNHYQRYNATNGWYDKIYDLPAGALNQSTVFVGFLFHSQWGYNCYFDDVTIQKTPPATATWTGAAKSDDWHDANNWDTGVPGAITDVTIPSGLTTYPTINASAACNNITIESGATGDGSLLDGGYLTVYGSVTAERYLTADDYHNFSPSVSGETADAFHLSGATGLNVYLYSHNEASNDFTEISSLTTPLNPFQGYTAWVDGANATPPVSNWTFDFTGGLNTGSFGSTDNVVLSAPGDWSRGWNYFGNPYLSAIDWDAIPGWTKTYIDATVYIYNTALNQWATYSAAGGGNNGGSNYIAMGQGFWVKRTNDLGGFYPLPGTLIMDNDVRVHNSVGYLKSEIANIVKLQVSGNEYTDETSILFREDATVGFDSQYDAYKLPSVEVATPQLYSIASTNHAVNVLPETEWVQLGFTAGVTGEYTISATEINDFSEVVLEDLFTGIQTDLLNNSYTFTYTVGDDEARFIVHFTPLAVDENAEDIFGIYSYNKDVYVSVPENTKGDIVIYNIMGQEVASAPINSAINKITLEKSAYYVVKVLSDESLVTRKVFIK